MRNALVLSFFLFLNLLGDETLVDPTDRIPDRTARIELVKALLSSTKETSLLEARVQIDILLPQGPDDPEILILLAQIDLREDRYAEADAVLEKLLAMNLEDPKLIRQIALAETGLGYASTAKKLFEKLLEKHPDDDELMQDYVGSALLWGDYYQAEAYYRAHPPIKPYKLAFALRGEQRFYEAEEIYLNQGSDPKALYEIAMVKMALKEFDNALEIAEQLRSEKPENLQYLLLQIEAMGWVGKGEEIIELMNSLPEYEKVKVIKVLEAAGEALERVERFQDARTIFEKLQALDPENIKALFYLAGKENETAEFISHVLQAEDSPQWLQRWGDLYASNGLGCPAYQFYARAVELRPEFFPAQVSLAGMHAVLFEYEDSITLLETLLNDFPNSYRLQIELARAFSWNRKYGASLILYDRLIALNPENPVPILEKARVECWAKLGTAFPDTYETILFNETLPDRLLDAVCLERQYKMQLWEKKPLHAMNTISRLIAIAPGNEEARFDYAQIFCSAGLSDEAQNEYFDLLYLDPLHNMAQWALNRETILQCPSACLYYSYWHEIGYGVLANIRRQRIYLDYNYPLANWLWLHAAAERWIERPYSPTKTYDANGATIGLTGTPNRYLSFAGSLTSKSYTDKKLGTKFSGYANTCFNLCDKAILKLGYERQDILTNYYGIQQGIQAGNTWVEVDTHLTHKWDASAAYQYWRYSDHNQQNCLLFQTSYQWTEAPCAIKFIGNVDYRNTAHTNIYIYKGDQLVNIIHPYWAPQHYWAGRITLEWYHEYLPIQFCGDQKRYYDMKFMYGNDNTHNTAFSFEVEWHHEFLDQWAIEFKGLIYRSVQWNAEGVWATLKYIF